MVMVHSGNETTELFSAIHTRSNRSDKYVYFLTVYHDSQRTFSLSSRGIKDFGIRKLQRIFEVKDYQIIHCRNVELWKPEVDYLTF